jgi:hypothetical protein
MSYSHCKHDWKDRTETLRAAFPIDSERRIHSFFVCARCLRIDEQTFVEVLPVREPTPLRLVPLAA